MYIHINIYNNNSNNSNIVNKKI